MDKKYDQLIMDAAAQTKWQTEQTYTFDATKSEPLFSIDTPPPTVSGSLHIGHVFSYTQTDIIARFKRFAGFNVLYPFGFDDNGLATERFVEKKHSVTGHSMKRSEFIALCLKQSHESAQEFKSLWTRLGISADWSRTYSTISPEAQKISQASFIDLYNKGYIYRKEEPALYCTSCFTSVAQAELDDCDMPSQFNDITFKGADGSDLVIATTRPELLPSCVAIFYHPDDARYTHLKGTHATVPVYNYEVPLLADELVDPAKGTGLVMCCTFGDKNDIAWFKKYSLPYRQSINFDGKWSDITGELAGLKAVNARQKMLEILTNLGIVKNQRSITHPVNVHERCKKAIEYVVLKQWFLNILDHKQTFLQAADAIHWYPQFMQTRYRDWVEHLQWDWCLSRQRFYGIPFPVWHCNACKAMFFAKQEQLPIDPQETPFTGSCTQCGSTDIKGDTDVMDTWNTSSLTPYIAAQLAYPAITDPISHEKTKKFLPMSMRPQAHDIIRTWAFYTIIKTWLHNKTIPWKSIVISGHVLSAAKDKISKSQGNNPLEPAVLLAQYPADAIRYWTASGTLGYDVAFSDNQLKIGVKLQTKLWNAFRFIEEHLHDVPATQPENLGTINEWLVHSLHTSFKKYESCLQENEFSHALAAVERFFWQDFCDNYIELVKDQLFNPEGYFAETVTATKWTLHHVGLRLLQLFAPYMPHITEVLYGSIFSKTGSLHLTHFADTQTPHHYPQSAQDALQLITIVSTVRKLKTGKELSLKAPLACLTLAGNDDALSALKAHEQLIKGITHAQDIKYSDGTQEESSLTQRGDLFLITINLETEREAA